LTSMRGHGGTALGLAVVLLAGCNNLLGIEDLRGPAAPIEDAMPGDDGMPDGAEVPATVMISGTTNRLAAQTTEPIAGVLVEYYDASGTPRATMSSDAAGAFTLTIPTQGAPLDGYLRASDPSQSVITLNTYFSRPLVADAAGYTLGLFTDEVMGQLASFCSAQHGAAFAVIVALVGDAREIAVPDVAVTTDPSGSPCTFASGTPMPGNITASDGSMFVLELPPGGVLVTAQGIGSRTVTAEPGAISMVPVTP
jgi:hypothetical protein